MTVRNPAARAIESSRAHTEPLPLVPATSAPRSPRCGSPSTVEERLDALEPELHPASLERRQRGQRAGVVEGQRHGHAAVIASSSPGRSTTSRNHAIQA